MRKCIKVTQQCERRPRSTHWKVTQHDKGHTQSNPICKQLILKIQTIYIYILTSIKFNYIQYKIEKVIVWLSEIYLCVHANLIIYVIVTDILII